MDCELFILALLHDYGGTFESVTKLQKIAFLSVKEGGMRAFTKFIWHHYGPFSKELQDATEILTKDGLAIEEQSERTSYFGDQYTIRRLRLTPRGRLQLETRLTNIDSEDRLALRKTLSQYGDQPLSKILDYVYRAYSPQDL